jgi:hypothetical protein
MECAQYSDLLDKAHLLTQKLFKQGHVALMLKSSLQKFVNTIVSFLRRLCFSSITDNTFTELDYIYR